MSKIAKKKVVLETDWVLDFFEIKKTPNPILNQWESATYPLTTSQHEEIQHLAANYEYEGDAWNEEELKVRFLAAILRIAEPDEKDKIKTFLERNITADYKDYTISVDVDLMMASTKGLNTPKKPYFFLQELKKGKKSTNDPEAQMLAAMLAAQILNDENHAIFGGYVVGRLWFFAVLEGKNYTLSQALDVTKVTDLQRVIYCLRKIKEMI
jgi:hypothetical protein